MDSLEEYYEKSYDGLCKSLSRVSGSYQNAEDIVQESFCRALLYWDRFDPEKGSISNWFSVILYRSFKDFMRVERNKGMNLDKVEDEETYPCEEVQLLHKEQCKMVEHFLSRKTRPARDILYLYFFKEYKPRDIKEILGVKVSTINQTAWRFRKEMEVRLGESI